MITPVILSGGEGRRLWPLSSPTRPKQFLALTGDETLLQQTVRRVSDPALFAPPIIVGGALRRRFLIAEQLRERRGSPRRPHRCWSRRAATPRPRSPPGLLLAHAADPDAR